MMRALSVLAGVLIFVAILSRLGSDKGIPKTIASFFSAMTNIFKGVFGQ